MRTVADHRVLRSLEARLEAISVDSQRRWGALTAHEMLCHQGDATAMVLGTRPRPDAPPVRVRRIVKLLGLWSPIPWPRGWPSNPHNDPKAGGTRPSGFEADRARAIEGLRGIAAAASGELSAAHGFFGRMSLRDWQRWAYRHSHHHLRQFGV